MKPSIYLETTVISYLTARPSRDVIRAGHQNITRRWWRSRRRWFTLYVSQLVIDEARRGDAVASARRMRILSGIDELAITDTATTIAKALLEAKVIPKAAKLDALHVGVAAAHGIEYLLTWNCKHIANAEIRPGLIEQCRSQGCEPPTICTPEELMGW